MIKNTREGFKMPQTAICQEQILSEEYYDFIIGPSGDGDITRLSSEPLCEQHIGFWYKAVYLEREIAEPLTLDRFFYNSIPKCYTLLDMEAMNQAGISQVQNYPNLELKGEGVMIGFVDTGIDYENPIFRNADGTTRIAGIWDQTQQDGIAPRGFAYGSEYTQQMLNKALEQEYPVTEVPSVDMIGHGTFLASVSAGGPDLKQQFVGAAPKATIAMVKLKPAKNYLKQYYFIKENTPCYQENDIMAGIAYLNELAETKGLPLSICVALGTNMGGHNGRAPLVSVLDRYGNMSNRVVVIGGGNEANQRHHFLGKIETMSEKEEVEIRVGTDTTGYSMELWTTIPNVFTISLLSPSGERIPNIPIRVAKSAVYEFVLDKTKVSIDYRLVVEKTNSELIFFRFEKPTPGIWKVIVEPLQLVDGIFHCWLPVTEFLTGEVYFLQSNPNYTLTEPASALTPITVSYYDGTNNSIAISSGRGYTRNEQIKPDFATVGVEVLGATSRNLFATRTGSSIAAGITAGASALVMEWIVYQLELFGVDSIQIKSLLILGTERDKTRAYPNREWGYGTLNLFRMFEELRQL